MRKKIVTGIDVGTYHIKVVVAEVGNEATSPPRVIGTGYAKSSGLRHGYIINATDIVNSINSAISQAGEESGATVKSALISFGGSGLDELKGRGKVAISSPTEKHITKQDVEDAIQDAKRSLKDRLINKKIIHTIPLKFYLDSSEVHGSPIDMQGTELEVDVLFITALEQHMNDLIAAVEGSGVEVLDTVASPIAASLVTLNKMQKMAGCVLVNIGAETVSLIVYEDNIPISVKVFPVGSSSITNDIALGLKVPLVEAEQIKLGSITGSDYPKKKLDDIITARLKDILKLVDSHLKDIGKSAMLPAGIVLTGGGSGIMGIEDLAKSILRLPSELASSRMNIKTLKDSTWAVAYGLCIIASNSLEDKRLFSFGGSATSSFFNFFKKFLP